MRAVLCVLALSLVLAGCDKCSDLFAPFRGKPYACKGDGPRPQ